MVLLKALIDTGLPIALAISITYVLLFPEKVQIWASYVWRLIALIIDSASKKVISNEIVGHVNNFSKQLSKELTGVTSKKVKVEWVKEAKKEAFVKEGQIILRMRHHRDTNKNMATIAMLYVGKAIVPQAKQLIGKGQAKAIDLYMARSFLDAEKPDATEELHESYFLPASEETKRYFGDFLIIDKHGLFVRVLLQELVLLGKRFLFSTDRNKLKQETKQLVNFLKKIVERERGEKVPLTFAGKFAKVGVILVAKPHRREIEGVKPYVKRFNQNKKLGLEEIYLLAWDKRNMDFLEKILKKLRTDEDFYQKKVVKYGVRDKDIWFRKAKLAMFQKRQKGKALKIRQSHSNNNS